MRQIILAIVLLSFSVVSFAQHVLKGRVTDDNGVVLQGATVFIVSEKSGQVTDQNGAFTFSNLKLNRYDIQVSYIGFETATLSVATDVDLKLQLKPKTYSINELTVSSTRANNLSAVAYSEVTKEDIQRRNLGQDIPYLLALSPGFITTSDAGTGVGYTGFRIRGTDANRTNITVNGVPLNDAESHGTFFVNMPDFASSLSSVQVQRGVGTSTNGAAAFGASINMQTETLNPKAYGEISSIYGSFNTNKNTLKLGTGLMSNGFAFDARLSNVTSDGYIDRAWVDMKSYYFSAGYYKNKTILKFLTFGGIEKTYQAWNGVNADSLKSHKVWNGTDTVWSKPNRTYNELGKYTDNSGNTQYYDNQTDNYRQTHYQLHWIQELNDKLNLNVTTHYTRGKGYYEEYKEARKYNEYGLIPDTIAGLTQEKTDLVRQKWLENDFYGVTFALNYSDNRLNLTAGGAANRYDGDHYGKVIWVRNATNLDMSKEWYRNRGVKDDINFYLKANAETFKNLFATVDLQYRYIGYTIKGADDKYDSNSGKMIDITQEHYYNFFNPKIGLTYKIDDSQDVYASFSISNREPNRNNYTERLVSDPKPKSERLLDYELGYRYASPEFSASANLYYMKYKNQLILTGKVSEIGELLTTNIPNSYRAGIELSAGWKPAKWFHWDANVAISENKIKKFTEEGVDVYDENWNWVDSKDTYIGTTNISYSPDFVANNVFVFNIKGLELALYSNYVSKQYFDNTSSDDRAIDAYFVSNLGAKYTLPVKGLKGIDLQLIINNIFNEKYENNAYSWYSYYLGSERINEKRYFPQAGTNLMGSVTIRF